MTDFDPDAPLNRIKGESIKAHGAFMDYFLMGAGRSFSKLFEQWERIRDATEPYPKEPPTKRFQTLKDWSSTKKFHWQARIARQTEIDNEIAIEQFRQGHMTGPEVIKRLSDMGRADMAAFADVRSPADLKDNLHSHLVKKITVQARRHKDGTITAKTVIELYDAQAALEKLMRHLGLFEVAGDSEDKPLIIKVLKGVSMDDI